MSYAIYLPFLAALLAAALGVLTAVRAKRSIGDWALVAGMSVIAAERFCGGMSLRSAITAAQAWQQWRMLCMAAAPGAWLVFALTYARGNAAEFLQRWRSTWVAGIAIPVVFAAALHGRMLELVSHSVHSEEAVLWLTWTGVALYGMVLGISLLVLLHLERTFRASVGIMRWRIKFMLLGAGLLFAVRMYTGTQTLLFRVIDPHFEIVSAAACVLALALMARSFMRSGTFEIAVYPSRSVLHGSLTVLIAGVYLLAVGVFARVAAYFGGDAGFTVKAFLILVGLVLLAVLFQSDRIRLRLRQFVSRHFDRPLYDYSAAWRTFTEATASRVEQGDVCRSLVKLIADTFSALSVTIWLVDDKSGSLRIAASTALSDKKARELEPTPSESKDVVSYLQRHAEPIDVEGNSEPWAVAVRRWAPSEFAHGGHRLCIPLVGRGEVLGLIVIGDRVSGVPFSLLDFDMLKCVGDHAAANLLNVQLSRKLVASKELEAFQTMATFFVHDLKNAAWTLNLMLQNLPVHFDNPEFRADALRAIGKTASHINQLTSRLGVLRHELKIKPAERDLNEVVKAALAGLNEAKPETIVRDLQPVSKALIDQEQLQKVVVNLVVNAIEASPADGQVRVATGQRDNWVVLDVSDQGCGMSEEFIRQSLFRPFQTTKKHGLGIGMFQSRMIVEAHGGRIQATSQVGQGSTFQILIPIRSQTE